jgi:uncharacterized membrane protein
MKKHFISSTYFVGLLAVFIATCFYLVPEKNNLTIEVKLRDSIDELNLNKDALSNYHKKINEIVSKELAAIRLTNETNIVLLSETIKTNGGASQQVKNIYEVKQYQDSINKLKVTALIDKYGWLGVDRIGAQNNYTLFTVIENSDFTTQEKYLTVMEQAVKSGTLAPEHFASLLDRKAIVQHQQQIFGTQITNDKKTGKNAFVKIIKEESVNERRKEIGLMPIELYAKQNNVEHHLM